MQRHNRYEIIILMIFPKSLITVTPLSKFLVMALFIVLPIVGFILGTQYQQVLNSVKQPETIATARPTPVDETANWKTYTNTKLNLSLSYPPTYIVDEKISKENALTSIDNSRFFITLTNDNTDLVISHPALGRGAEDLVRTKQVLLGNQYETQDFFGDSSNNVNMIRIIFEDKNENSFLIIFSAKGDRSLSEDEISIFNQILSTFQFTD